MTDIRVRQHVVEALRALLPERYTVEPYQRIPDVITGPTAIVKQQRIGRAVTSRGVIPGGRIAGLTLSLAVPHEDVEAAEDALDDDVVTLLNAIDQAPNLRWTSAEKRTLSDTTYIPCYDVELEFPFRHNRKDG